ncbi:MAG: EAL domain-containing protein [Devosia sp.]|uniref:putative bifunctional diguanylate cyclase/phosphodiesterase n=1 Tax=Devosia sp. TaxID=1871048 RepID=UPI001A60AD1F|nr:EAL domain-containing protein [Devosia sp.]MBL8596188.1 EAL domain-containing protein [Devosia sp.]
MEHRSARLTRDWRFPVVVLLPVILSLVGAAAGVLGFVLWSAQGVDAGALTRQTDLARHVIETELKRIPHDQESVTIWDDAIYNTKLAFNAAWIDTNLGTWMREYFGHDDVIVLDQDDQPIYAMSEGARADPGREAAALGDIRVLIANLRRLLTEGGADAYEKGNTPTAPNVAALRLVGGVPSLVSIAPIISDSGTIKQDPDTIFLHVSIVRLDVDYAQRLGEQYQIPDAGFDLYPDTSSGRDGLLPLTDSAGRFITFLQWTPVTPGRDLLMQTLPVIAGAFLIAGLVAALLVHQLWRKSHALEVGRADAEYRAAHDHLTGLPNRTTFEAILARTLAQRPSRDRRTSVLMLDLDRFKQVNDTLGHRAGDDLIQAVGQRLGEMLANGDTLARLGGDEFAIVHAHAPGLMAALGLSQRIVEAINKPFDIFGSEAFVGVSIGIATADLNEADAHELTRRADIALYEAKATGRNRAVVFEDSMNEFLQNRKTIEVELREALRRDDQLSVAFQPLFGRDGQIVGAEALARWVHPRLGQISPAHFIPVAEATGLISQLGAFVLRAACSMGAKWPGHTFAANISPVQLRDPTFTATVLDLLRTTGMQAQDLELEITEGILLEEASEATEALRLLRSTGIKIALDDFGTGYSSLNYLKRYPVDRIKIDRSFVSQLAPGSVSVAIVQAMVTLAHALKIEVTAEGVETHEQAEVLDALGCNIYQGFLFSAPVSPGNLEAVLRQPRSQVA